MILNALNFLQLISASVCSATNFDSPFQIHEELLSVGISGKFLSTFYGFNDGSIVYLYLVETNVYNDDFNSSYAIVFNKEDFLNNYSITLEEKVEKKSKEEIHNLIMTLSEKNHPYIQECYGVYESKNFYVLLYENDSNFSFNEMMDDLVLNKFQYKKVLFSAFSGVDFLYENDIFGLNYYDSFILGFDSFYNIKLSGFMGITSYLSGFMGITSYLPELTTKKYILKNNDLFKIYNDNLNTSETYLKLKNSVFIKFIESLMNMMNMTVDETLTDANYKDFLIQAMDKSTINLKEILELDYFDEVTFRFINFMNLKDFDRETYSGAWNKKSNVITFQNKNKDIYKIIQNENKTLNITNVASLFFINFRFFINDDEINPNNLFEDEFKSFKEKITMINNELQLFKDATFKYKISTELFEFYESIDRKNFLIYKKDLLTEIDIFMIEKDEDKLFLVDERYLKSFLSLEHQYYGNIVEFINFLICCYYEIDNENDYGLASSEYNTTEHNNAENVCDGFNTENLERLIEAEFYIHQLTNIFVPGIGFMKKVNSSINDDEVFVYEIINYNIKVVFDGLDLSIYEENDELQYNNRVFDENKEDIRKFVAFLFEASISCRIKKFYL